MNPASPQPPLRILLIGNFFSEEKITPQVCQTLSMLFHAQGLTVYRAGRYENKLLRIMDMSLSLLRLSKKIDLVCIDTFSGPAFSWAALLGRLCRWLKTPYIPVLHGGKLPEFAPGRERKIHHYLRGATHIVAPSVYLSKWSHDLGFEASVIPNPVNTALFQFKHRTQFSPRLLWMRRLHEVYHPEMAIEALGELCKEFPESHLSLAGSDSGRLENCKKISQKLGLENNISFHGFLSPKELSALAQECDIFINTSRADNLPVCLLEAAALGLPIVSTNVGGIPDYFIHNEEVLLVDRDDTSALVAAIKKVIHEPQSTVQRIHKLTQKTTSFSKKSVLAQWCTLFEKVAR